MASYGLPRPVAGAEAAAAAAALGHGRRRAEKPSTPLPMYEETGLPGSRPGTSSRGIRKITVKPLGESGRSGLPPPVAVLPHRLHELQPRVARRQPPVAVAVAAIACQYTIEGSPRGNLIVFILSYIGMVPCANMIGFAGQELARKVPHVWGILIETA